MAKDKKYFDWFVKKHGHKNIGWRNYRMKYPCHSTDREKAFAREWRKENERRAGIDYGNGILQDNFCDSHDIGVYHYNVLHEISNRERVIVATIIQWLGTNVGFCFLEKVLNSCGYKIIKQGNNLN